MRRSSVMLTAPSVEFSTGTTPYSTRVCSTSSKTSAIDRDGAYVGPLPKCWSAAWCVNVARGPRNATDSARSSARHRSEEHTSELQSRLHLVCRLLLEK